MKRKTLKIIFFIILVVGLLLVSLFASMQMEDLSYLTMAATFGGMIVCMFFLRCPHCGAWPRKGTMFTSYCPCCGENLDD